MKISVTNLAETPQTPVFPKTLHRLQPNPRQPPIAQNLKNGTTSFPNPATHAWIADRAGLKQRITHKHFSVCAAILNP
jgi:hypothetical protein